MIDFAIVFLPLLGALIAGLFGRRLGDLGSQIVTCVPLLVAAILSGVVFVDVAINGNVRVAASSMRRITKPQPPPVRCCSINNASEPMAMPVQNVQPIRYD